MNRATNRCIYNSIVVSILLAGLGCNVHSANSNYLPEERLVMNAVATKIAELPVRSGITPRTLSFSPDGSRIAIRTADSTITVWDWKKRDIITTVDLPEGANDSRASRAFQFSPDGKYLASCHSARPGRGAITIWNTSTWKIESEIGVHAPGSDCTALAFSPDGKRLIRLLQKFQHQQGNTLEVYDTSTWQILGGIRTNPLDSAVLAVSPDGKQLAVGGTLIPLGKEDGQTSANPFNNIGKQGESYIAVLDSQSLNLLRAWKSQIEVTTFSRLAWNSESARVVHVAGHGIEIFDPNSQTEIFRTPATGDMAVADIAYTGNGKYLIEVHGERLNQLRIRDAKQNSLIQTEPGEFGAVDVSADSHYVATGESGKTVIWQLNK